jgi:conjugative transfer region protein TrbK
MRAHALVFATLVVTLSACNREDRHDPPSVATDASVSSTVEKCAKGGDAAAYDPACKRASDENFQRFMGKDSSR